MLNIEDMPIAPRDVKNVMILETLSKVVDLLGGCPFDNSLYIVILILINLLKIKWQK